MKKNMNGKIRLVLTVAVCVLFVAVAFSSAVGKNPSNRNFVLDNKENGDTPSGPPSSTSKLFRPISLPEWFYKIFNYDWNYWSNPPDMYAIPMGNVGIGTNEPQSTLDIYDSDEPAEIRLASGLPGGSGTIKFGNSGWIIRSGFAAPPQSIGFRYGGDEVMTLWGDNVGIGTTEPQNALHVDGAINLNPIDEPAPPSTGFLLYCDASDGYLKTMDEFGSTTILAVPIPPP